MINPKSLIKLSRKWQRRILFPSYRKIQSFVPAKGHIVVYSTDEKRFMVPLEFLSKNVLVELFRLAESEFGLPRNGPITLPCDAVFLEYVISLLRGFVPQDLEKALLSHCSTSCSSDLQQLRLVHGF